MAKNTKKNVQIEEAKVKKAVKPKKVISSEPKISKKHIGDPFICLKSYWKQLKNYVSAQERNTAKHSKKLAAAGE